MATTGPAQDAQAVLECIDRYRKLEGLPPYDVGSNICMGDSYFAVSIERDFSEATRKKAKVLFNQEKRAWKKMRNRFIQGKMQ